MSRELRREEIAAVVALDGPRRYAHFVKQVADAEMLWSLWQNGWALAGDCDTQEFAVVWPHRSYAEMCATGAWTGYEPRPIELIAWLERWTQGLEADGRAIAVFPTPTTSGIVVSARDLEADLRRELDSY